jgi:divalent metal cation (Fe/Co/Zn/Cd) transporter
MQMNTTSHSPAERSLYNAALLWALFGVIYNIMEGIVSVGFGIDDDTLTLFGFGIDSFIEAISAVGIAHMVWRIRTSPQVERDRFEAVALKITGTCFYLLAVALLVGGGINLWRGTKPETTLPGVVIAVISISIMWAMLSAKIRIGNALHSNAMLADAHCTQVCIYMSVVLLLASAFYELTGIGSIDAFGSIALAWFSYREGVEAFEKAAGNHHCGCDHKCN